MSDHAAHKRRQVAELMLFVSTAAWATTFPAMRWLVSPEGADIGIWTIVAIRFTIGAALTLAWCPSVFAVRGQGREWASSLWLGVLLAVAFVTQTVGMETTTAGKAAFITALFVVFVPLLQVVHLRRPLGRGAAASVGIALIGLVLLEKPWGGGMVIGDLWVLGCSVGYSLYIVELQRLSPGANAERLLFGQMALVAALGLAAGGLDGTLGWPTGIHSWALLLYLAVVCTFFATLLHNRYQRETTPTRTALIFTTEPVMAAAVAYATLGETLSAAGVAGGAIILAAVVLSEILPRRPG